MKLISLVIVGALFCGTLGQASTKHPRLLSFDQLMSLNIAQRADYIGTIRDAIMRSEKAQAEAGIEPQARNKFPQLPNFADAFSSQALASDDYSQYCIYAGNISHLTGPAPTSGNVNSVKCHALLNNDECSNPKEPTLCNTFLFGSNVCVPVPSGKYPLNSATRACMEKTKNLSLEEIAKGIKVSDENKIAWEKFKDEINGYCGDKNPHPKWRNAKQASLCVDVTERTDKMAKFLDAHLNGVPAPAPVVVTLPPADPQGGCNFTVDGEDPKNVYHSTYGIHGGVFSGSITLKGAAAPGVYPTVTSDEDCLKATTTLPRTCNIYISKRMEDGSVKFLKLADGTAAGADINSTLNCAVSKYADDIPAPVAEVVTDDPLCSPANIGDFSQIFCSGQSLDPNDGRPFKVVMMTDYSNVRSGNTRVRMCESQSANGPWTRGEGYSSSAIVQHVNATNMDNVKKHARFLGMGKKTLTMPFSQWEIVDISRFKSPKPYNKDGVQTCEFTEKFEDGHKEFRKTDPFRIMNLDSNDSRGNPPPRTTTTTN